MDQVFVAGPAVDDVDAKVAGDLVAVAGPADDLVVAEVPVHLVLVAGAAVDFVVAPAAVHLIRAGAATDQVVAEAAEDDIVARTAPDHVAFGGPADHVGPVGADNPRLAPVAARHLFFAAIRSTGYRRESGERQQQRQSEDPPEATHVGWIVLRRCGSASY